MSRNKNKEYYAVVKGRVDEPTIFSSWGNAHPRVTGCPSRHRAFVKIEQARTFMADEGLPGCKEDIEATVLDTTPKRNSKAFYAVAHGERPGIRVVWYGKTGALEAIHEKPGACHKRFRTMAQAEAFMNDWKKTAAKVGYRAEGLDHGLSPSDMNVRQETSVQTRGRHIDVEDITEQLGTGLDLEDRRNCVDDEP